MSTVDHPEPEKVDPTKATSYVAHDDSDLEDEVLPPQCRIDNPDCEGCE